MLVVHDVAVKYRLPARLDDELQATASITRLAGASMVLQQSVCRDGDVLAEGEVTIACVDRAGVKPRRMPSQMVSKLRPLVQS